MKKLSLLVLLCVLLAKLAGAATISGYVNNYSTTPGQPAVNQKVYLYDTSFAAGKVTFLDSTLTNSSGFYSFTVSSSVPTNGSVALGAYVYACGTGQYYGTTYYGSSKNWNFSICVAAPPPYRIEGYVWDSTGGSAIQAKVYLIAITAINTSTADTTIAAIDSFVTDNQGMFAKNYYSFATSWPSSLRIKAILDVNDANYAAYLPTYYRDSIGFRTSRPDITYGHTLSWRAAGSLTAGEMTGAEIPINMIAGANPGGPGFVGGSVLLGANKNAGVGDPLSKRLLLLTKSTGEAVAYTYSDANGKFSFPRVPLGNYLIFGDALGKSNPALAFTLTQTNKSASTIVFEENSKAFKGRLNAAGVGNSSAVDAISVFPNPVRDVINVQGLSAIKGDKTIVLLDMKGAEVARQTITTGEGMIPAATLPAGVYMLHVQTMEGTATFRVTK